MLKELTFMNRKLVAMLALAASCFAQESAPSSGPAAAPPSGQPSGGPPTKRPRLVRPGVKDTSTRREMSTMKPDAVFEVPGVPDWLVVTEDAVWVSNKPKNSITRMDVKTNKIAATIPVGEKPCSGIAAGFGSIWVPNCGDNTLSRVDMKTNQVVATIPVGPANSEGGIATGAGSVWMLTDAKGKLSRIDPKTNKVIAEIEVPADSFSCVFGDGAVWVSSTGASKLLKVDPKTNKVAATIDVGPNPRFLTIGGGAVWTLNQGDGTVSRVDTKTAKLVTNIEAGIPGPGGEIDYADGYVWITVFQIPVTRIDAKQNKVVQQWFGPGGDAIRVGHGSIWLSNLREQNVWRVAIPPVQ
jgi:virginiamycin B lyase